MCLSFVHKGKDIIVGFNFDVDDKVWDFKVFPEKDRFYIGIKVDGKYLSFHGVNAKGNVSNLLYVGKTENGVYKDDENSYRLDDLAHRFIENELSFEGVIAILNNFNIVNAPNCSLQSQLTDKNGRALIIDPGRGIKLVDGKYSVLANFSLFDLDNTMNVVGAGVDRFSKVNKILKNADKNFNVYDGLKTLESVKQGLPWPTRVSFVYSVNQNKVYYVLDGKFDKVYEHQLVTI